MKHSKNNFLVIFSFTIIGLISFLSCETENGTGITNIETELSANLITIDLNENLLVVSQSCWKQNVSVQNRKQWKCNFFYFNY